jgi:DNA phosphorothioation-associated putative methyltransferase
VRHRTAIKRYDLSKPVKQLLERDLLRKGDPFFDFGCGHGMDVEALQQLGYQASGWDPAFRPNAPKTPAAAVILAVLIDGSRNAEQCRPRKTKSDFLTSVRPSTVRDGYAALRF